MPDIPSITAALASAEQEVARMTRARDVLLAARDVEQLALEAPDRASTYQNLKAKALRELEEAEKATAKAKLEQENAVADYKTLLAELKKRGKQAEDLAAAELDKTRTETTEKVAALKQELAREQDQAAAARRGIRAETQAAQAQLDAVNRQLDAIKASLA